ncbi:pre-rRNA-processing protein ESF1 [Brachypodium distachyon]|uniref:Uncharacterized protein n=1 Tax=Brachypodium distachyon TaxID=15368 RepID=I1GTT2_BRADI|nr:pre-rRNA-processing protein ESF1 [Brachypodium distachyon]KQK15917.1 hypothetical protein BRADI_1g25780v3 [Brachypodium distachyon]|eukprot:XP_003562988.1 pre-rRNA-processing protein ESF1 [Brachypodium distachyon]
MAPPANLKGSKKAKKSSSKDEKKLKKNKHERPTADEAPQRHGAKRKHKDGQEEKEHGKKFKNEKKAEAEAAGAGADEAKRGNDKMRRAMEDERFAAARTDPRFRPIRRKESKVALDPRFSSMLTDPMFDSSEAPVDKRGRRRKKGAKENPMLHYYLNQEEGDEKDKKKEKEKLIGEEDGEMEEEDQQDEEDSSSSDDEEEEEEDDDQYSVGSDIAHYLMAQHDDTPMIDKETHRLAVVNMDWDHIKAVDLYMVMTSCIPKGGQVLSVSIYPSEFGRKCLEIETTQGPSALVGADGDGDDNKEEDEDVDDDEGDDDEDGDDEDNSEPDSETENNKLRTYELNRLRYYYAVVVCDSSATANHLYTTLDRTEFLKTANVFDLQFIPDSMEFKHPARDVATEAPPSYKEPDFETRALQHSKVKLTWDDDEPERKKILRRKFNDDQLDDLGVFLASDDSSSDDDVDAHGDESLSGAVVKRKLTNKERVALLLQGDKSDEEQTDDQDMEITFNTELEDLSKRIIERKSTEKKTVWEKHQEKMKEKRKARKRVSKDDDDYSSEDGPDEDDDFFDDDEKSDDEVKPSKKQKVKPKDKGKGKGKDKLPEEHFEPEATKEELELLVAADEDAANGAKGYNLKRKSKKGKKGKEVSVEDKVPEIDLSKDERFSDMFTSHLYAIDPTDPQYKRSAAFLRKQAGKQGAHAGRLDTEPPVEDSSLGSTLAPDDASPKNAKQKRDGASTEKLQMLSAVKSLKRNLTAFKNASAGDR